MCQYDKKKKKTRGPFDRILQGTRRVFLAQYLLDACVISEQTFHEWPFLLFPLFSFLFFFFSLVLFSFSAQYIYIYRRRRRNDFGGVSGWSNLYRWLYSGWVRDRSPNIYFQGLFRVVCILSSRYWLRHRAEARQGFEDGCLWYSVLVVSSEATPRTNATRNISRSADSLVRRRFLSITVFLFFSFSATVSIKASVYFAYKTTYRYLESSKSGLFHGDDSI